MTSVAHCGSESSAVLPPGSEPVKYGADQRYEECEEDRGEAFDDLFVARAVELVGNERSRPYAQSAGEGQVAGAKGSMQLRFAYAEHDQCDKFKEQAGAVEGQVNGDQPFKGKLERQCPGKS